MFCSKTPLLDLKVPHAIIIVDCGGSTVDLIAYKVENEQPFSVAPCTKTSGGFYGSTILNRNFSSILRTKIQKTGLLDGSRIVDRIYSKCMRDFENRIKVNFRNDGQVSVI
jgi:hypothetical protein